MLTRFARHFLLALQFFTRIPVTGRLAQWVGYSPAMLQASAAHFPGVGWVVGGASALLLKLALLLLPTQAASTWVAVVLSMVFSVMLTGAFHEDGLADTADGLGGGLTRERALAIMKDSRIGTYGAVALVLALCTKLCLLVLLLQIGEVWAIAGLFTAHVVSRLMPLFLMCTMAYASDATHSKSKPVVEHLASASLWTGLLWWGGAMAMVNLFLPAPVWLAAGLGAACAAVWMGRRLQRRLQGFTGDGLGATQQLSELGCYLGMVMAAAWV
jgi:adenosylcobinamide-GDP ribazoletransferase